MRRGLTGGTGGASIPFRRDAPWGNSTVSTTEVVETSTGSLMSDFFTDIFRWRPYLTPTPGTRFGVLAEKEEAVGVELADNGGVGLAKEPAGVARPEVGKPGLLGPRPGDGDGRGEFKPGDSAEAFGGCPGEGRGDGTPNG